MDIEDLSDDSDLIAGDGYDDQGIARSGYADMLHDDARNKKYFQAIEATISSFKNSGLTPLRVVDIGTGTGLLSMTAVECARKINLPIVVTAFECYKPMAKCAEQTIKLNGYEKEITVIPTMSDSHPPFDETEKADILITELFDTELIGEGALHAYRHAIENFMKPNFTAVPWKARIWVQLVESPELRKFNNFSSSAFTSMGIKIPQEILDCCGAGFLQDLQMSQLKPDVDFIAISPPRVAFNFDFSSFNGLQLAAKKTIGFETRGKKVRHENIVVLFWWDLFMCNIDQSITLTMAPEWGGQTEWREHWIQAIYYPKLNSKHQDDESSLSLTCVHDDFSFWFSLDKSFDNPNCSCGHHLYFSRSRLHQLNNSKIPQIICSMLKKMNTPKQSILFLGDFSLVPLVISKELGTEVFCYDDRNLYSKWLDYNSFSNLKVLKSNETPNVDLVISEPYFSKADLPCDLLEFWYKCRDNERTHTLTNYQIIPNRVVIKCLPVEFDHLWKFRSEVIHIEKFKMDLFDQLVLNASDESDSDFESQPLWEYSGKAMAEPQTIFEWDWDQFKSFDPQEVQHASIPLPVINKKVLLVYWTEFYNFEELVSTSGPIQKVNVGHYLKWDKFSKQGVCFLARLVTRLAGKIADKVLISFHQRTMRVELVEEGGDAILAPT